MNSSLRFSYIHCTQRASLQHDSSVSRERKAVTEGFPTLFALKVFFFSVDLLRLAKAEQ